MSVQATELVTKFSFQGSTLPLAQYNKRLSGGIALLAGFTTALAASYGMFAKWSSGVIEATEPLVNLSNETDIAVGRIQELSYIATVSGSTAEAMQSSISGLTDKIGDAAQKGSEDFSRLGISVRNANGEVKTADQVLSEVQNRFQELDLSTAEQRTFAQALGIDRSLIRMLNLTEGEMSSLGARARELGTLTEEQAESVSRYNASLSGMRFGLDATKQMIAIGMAPQLEAMTESFTELLIANKSWIIDGIAATTEFIGEFLSAINRLLPVIGAMAAAFVVAKIGTLGFAGALGVIFSPAVAIAGAIVGILAIVDDLIVAFNGGKSVIRDFFLEFFDFDIVPVLNGIVEGFKDLVEFFISLITGDFSNAWDIFKRNALGVLESLKSAFRDFFNWVTAPLDNIKDSVLGFLGSDDGPDTAGSTLPSDGTLRPDEIPRVPGMNQDNRRVEQTNYIDVKSNDPEAAGRATGNSLQRQMDDAQTQLNPNRGGQ